MINALFSITRKVFTLTIVAALTSIKRAFVYIQLFSRDLAPIERVSDIIRQIIPFRFRV